MTVEAGFTGMVTLEHILSMRSLPGKEADRAFLRTAHAGQVQSVPETSEYAPV